MRFWSPLLALAGLALLAGCDAGNGPKKVTQEAGQSRGQALYETYCAACHSGGGDGDFSSGVPSINNAAMARHHLKGQIQEGSDDAYKPSFGGSKMPAFDFLSDEEIELILRYVQEL